MSADVCEGPMYVRGGNTKVCCMCEGVGAYMLQGVGLLGGIYKGHREGLLCATVTMGPERL